MPPAVKMFRLKVAADNGLPALFSTSRPGQANFEAGVGLQEMQRRAERGHREQRHHDQVRREGHQGLAACRPDRSWPTRHRRFQHRPTGRTGRPAEPANRQTGAGGTDRVQVENTLGGDDLRRLPHPQQQHQRQRPGQRRDDVGDLVGEEVRAEELRDTEGNPADQGGEPGLPDAAASVDHQHQDQRDEDREDRGLPAHHGAEEVRVQPGDLAQGGDRDRDCAERDRGGVGDQGDRRGLDRGRSARR